MTSGFVFLGFALAFGMSTSLSGTNLLYLLFALVLSMIPINGYLAWLVVWRVRVRRRFPVSTIMGERTTLIWTVENRGRVFPAIGINIRDFGDENVYGYVDSIKPQNSAQVSTTVCFARRGYFHFQKVWLVSSFPFGLTQRYYSFKDDSASILVYPAKVDSTYLVGLITQYTEGVVSSGKKGQGEEFYSLREYVPGDSINRIHWVSTARYRNLLVREFEGHGTRQVFINCLISSDPLLFEKAVLLTASLCRSLVSSGWSVGLHIGDKYQSYVNGQSGLMRLLEILAVVVPNMETPPSPAQIDEPGLVIDIGPGDKDTSIENRLLIGLNGWDIVENRFCKKRKGGPAK